MHSVTDRQVDRRTDNANSRSLYKQNDGLKSLEQHHRLVHRHSIKPLHASETEMRFQRKDASRRFPDAAAMQLNE